jgi:dTDP-glucose pyrophosphorylase
VRDEEPVLIGLPDTVWFPEDGYCALPSEGLSFLLFPVARPELFDAVISDDSGRVLEIQVKRPNPGSHWIWGGLRLPGELLHALHQLWVERGREDAYLGTLVNEYLSRGGEARCIRAGSAYYDVGTLDGYRQAMQSLINEGGSLVELGVR